MIFRKMRGGGSKTVWNFSENSSVLEGKGVPYLKDGSTVFISEFTQTGSEVTATAHF